MLLAVAQQSLICLRAMAKRSSLSPSASQTNQRMTTLPMRIIHACSAAERLNGILGSLAHNAWCKSPTATKAVLSWIPPQCFTVAHNSFSNTSHAHAGQNTDCLAGLHHRPRSAALHILNKMLQLTLGGRITTRSGPHRRGGCRGRTAGGASPAP